MKKILFALLILVMGSSFMQEDQFYVVYIKGGAINTVTSRGLRMGDMLKTTDKVLLKDANSKLVLIHAKRGRVEITPKSSGKDLTVKDQVVPISSDYKIVSRPLNYEGYNPRTYFHSPETNYRVLLVTGLPLKIIPFYKLDAQNFFYLQWDKAGTSIVRKIPASDRGIYFNQTVISDADQLTDGQRVKFCYQHFEYGVLKNDVLAEFVPVVAPLSLINQQVAIIKRHSSQKEPRVVNALVTAHLNDNYGKVGSEYLHNIR
ncbi:hypothetical protein [Sediminibacterium sp.]|uniref:hypothetical protein n=1 Tax=Sediminibacterium sp. TaxID=1917865 RepID=UPI0025F041BE|nr:hypothetical protein [Sediminibacterium sp.]